MKLKALLSARIREDDQMEINITGPSDKLLVLFEEAVNIFTELEKEGYPDGT